MAAGTIKVIEKNAGRKIGYELDGNTLWIGDAIAMKLQRLQTDDVVKKDICADKDGNLVLGWAKITLRRWRSRRKSTSISRERQTAKENRQPKEYRKSLIFPNAH